MIVMAGRPINEMEMEIMLDKSNEFDFRGKANMVCDQTSLSRV
jgi:hypothetical protein